MKLAQLDWACSITSTSPTDILHWYSCGCARFGGLA
jgi:hypothetical protein